MDMRMVAQVLTGKEVPEDADLDTLRRLGIPEATLYQPLGQLTVAEHEAVVAALGRWRAELESWETLFESERGRESGGGRPDVDEEATA
jgi:hypothetical protein